MASLSAFGAVLVLLVVACASHAAEDHRRALSGSIQRELKAATASFIQAYISTYNNDFSDCIANDPSGYYQGTASYFDLSVPIGKPCVGYCTAYYSGFSDSAWVVADPATAGVKVAVNKIPLSLAAQGNVLPAQTFACMLSATTCTFKWNSDFGYCDYSGCNSQLPTVVQQCGKLAADKVTKQVFFVLK